MEKIILFSIDKEELKEMIKEVIKEEFSRKAENEFLSFKETCHFLGVSPSFLNKMKSENRIPFKKMGKRIFFHRTEIKEALKSGGLYTKMKNLDA